MKAPQMFEGMFTPDTLMRTWSEDGFLVELHEVGDTFDTHLPVGYRFYDVDWARETGDASVIFQGADYGVPRHQAIDSDEAVRGLLTFLALRPGDTDAEYFDAYTERQTAWCQARAETLSMHTLDPEDEDEEYDHSRAKEDARNEALLDEDED